MNRDQKHFNQEYATELSGYLSGGGEASLTRAYELGRRAVSGGYGVLDLAEQHNHVMLNLIKGRSESEDIYRWVDLAGDFLKEALSAYEITHLGFQETTDLLRNTVQFATIVCHELRAPLTSIIASTGMLQEILAPEADSINHKLLSNIIAGASNLKARADSLTDIVGFESGILRLKISRVNLPDLVSEVQQHFEPQLLNEGVELNISMSENLPVIVADRERLEQVISNLVDNAIKYGAEGKVINLRVGVSNRHVIIEVQDFGRGIPVWDRPKLFQEHFRGERDRQKIQGLGIGLALCNAIVTAHSGTIWVESKEGEGSTFKVSLPAPNFFSDHKVTYESASN